MLIKYTQFGVIVLNNCIYTVGGLERDNDFNSAEVGGNCGDQYLTFVEYYNPDTDMWTSVIDMHIGRSRVAVGILNGLS
ncbi:Kelch repeat type 1,Kelch-type beta propeller [Cinara cedri]|uniref:Kelch repeat type 1,Kelch-type beta propeller n=1 Tax=Cinara cedri TaxID=506608 RepID=A0A5E4NLY4_9HEMI|nr:Kelch repeat type 1,Kelch-type beta propeller [Cinara cedri]